MLVRRKSSTDDEYHHEDPLGVFGVITGANAAVLSRRVYDSFYEMRFVLGTSYSQYITTQTRSLSETGFTTSAAAVPVVVAANMSLLSKPSLWQYVACLAECVSQKAFETCLAKCLAAASLGGGKGGNTGGGYGKGGGTGGGNGGGPCSSAPSNCPKGEHWERIVCPHGCWVGCVEDGLHEECGSDGTPKQVPNPKPTKPSHYVAQ
jgi:hypothetical protein